MMKRKNKFLSLLCLTITFLLSLVLVSCKEPDSGGDPIIPSQEARLEFAIDSKELFIYSTFQLRVNQTEGVTFESSDESVATVDENGLVYANGFGEATITAKVGEKSAECNIIVVGQSIVPSIEVSQDNVSLVWSDNKQIGSSFNVNPQIKFNGATFTDGTFTYSSSNPSVATVDENGQISAKGFGDAVISIQGNWRNRFDSSVLNKTVNVSVAPNVTIELIPESTVISTVNETIDGITYSNQTTFTANVALDGENFDTAITYIVEDENVVSISGNIITAKAIGETNIVAQLVVEGVVITSMPMVIEVVAPTVQLDACVYNVKDNPRYVIRGIEGDFLSLSINKVDYSDYVDADTYTLNVSEFYENVLGDNFIEISTTKYNYQYQVKFVTHIITNGDELMSCISNKTSTIYAILANDVSLSIGTFNASSASFTGTFDGQGYTIDARGTKLASVYGLFGRLKGELKNFALINVVVYGKESTVLGERIYEGGAVKNLYVQAKYEENTQKDYASLDKKNTLYYCGLFNRGFRFENVIVNIQYPENDAEKYALSAYNSVVLIENSYCFGNATQIAKTDSARCYQNLAEMLSTNLGSLTSKNGFEDFWYFDDKIIEFGNLLIEDKLVKDTIETEDSSITLNLGELTNENIQKLYVDDEEIAVPANKVLVFDVNEFSINEYHVIKIYTATGIVEQAFIFVVEEVIEVPERNLIKEFYKDKSNYPVETLSINNHVLGQENVYGISAISNNSATMYMMLSSEYMGQLFADETVNAITFDIILSTGTAKVQRGKNAEDLTVGATSINGVYYIYAVMVTRAHYETYGKTTDLMLRYTGGGASSFFYVDNLAVFKGDIEDSGNVGDDVIGGETIEAVNESTLVKSFYNEVGKEQTLTAENVVGNESGVYGISEITANNSSTMYIILSSEVMGKMFADETVNAITFDIILSTGTAKVQRGKNAEDLTVGATSNNDVYYIYAVTVTRAHYETYGKTTDLMLRYTGGGASSFFYVDNLTTVKDEQPLESQLIKDFYKKADTNYARYDYTITKSNDVMEKGNTAYGTTTQTGGAYNSTTMYMTLSYEGMKELFAEEGVNAITFDIILSVNQKKLQINAQDLPNTVSYSISSKTVDGVTYYVYSITITKDYYNTLTKDVTLRYTWWKDEEDVKHGTENSTFFYVDNLTTVKDET